MNGNDKTTYDAIIVGGSYAGIAAALQLARARRRVLVMDEGLRRNRFASHSHGFLGQDGRPPGDIAAEARTQLMRYPTVTWMTGRAEKAARTSKGFEITDSDGTAHHARRLLIAVGVVDELPAIPGLAERWGRSVFHCPYCHGYELMQGRIGVIAVSGQSMHHALMLPDWGPTTLLLNGTFEPDADQSAHLARRGVAVEAAFITGIDSDPPEVTLADGRRVPFAGLFVLPRSRVASPLAAQLGCVSEDGPLGTHIRVDEMQETSIPGVFACGDAARAAGSVALAVGAGTIAGTALHRSLLFCEDDALFARA
ncbi:thioredoxin reductase [Azospirillum melinis]|uniref:Thioredoxin reductase n=1 Tax=Azospirillum melinis TaxID=328839 RepID=A0ABX2KAQ8_9PROT|nr:NAD(P)/FAD-dependent oxidoreductase [Azospirillum melinis]MBP2309898.1 thioredoxin reductase [Azospirillum melinis]NUA98807.1 thioredoxin reductase [Azospirillum melinis]